MPSEAACWVVFWMAERVSARVCRVCDCETPRVKRRDIVWVMVWVGGSLVSKTGNEVEIVVRVRGACPEGTFCVWLKE